MKKCETFEDLQELGTEKIHERTHIARDKVELILTKSYAEIDKVKFMGFLSILEREYGLNLDSIREEYKAFRAEFDKTLTPVQSVIHQAPATNRTKWLAGGIGIIALLVGAGYLFQNSLSKAPQEDLMQLGGLAVEVVKETVDENLTQELNVSTAEETNASLTTPEPEPATASAMNAAGSVVITPIYKVWMGVIDLGSGEKIQKITQDPITLDAKKNALLVLGHGRVDIQSGDSTRSLKEKGTVWFLIENGVLRQITKAEFIERNGGKNW